MPRNEMEMSIIEHLDEFRKRIIICLISIIVVSIAVYFYSDILLKILTKPIDKLYFIKPTEALFTKMKISLYSGILFSLPITLTQFWLFFKPAMTKKESRFIGSMLPFSILLLIMGILFAFYLVLPTGLMILLSHSNENMGAMITLSAYFSFVFTFLTGFGLIFQMPVVVIILTLFGIVTPKFMIKKRRYTIVIIVLSAGIFTPGPDIFSQAMMAIPMLIIFEMSILLSKLVYSAKKKKRLNDFKY